MLILGIETSCDDTSVSVLENGKNIKSNIILSQNIVHEKKGGIVPEDAAREHVKNIEYVYKKALCDSRTELKDINYIAATYSPGLISSLVVGFSFAKALSYSSNIPIVPIHHIKGHIYSAFIEHDIQLPAIALIVSGGHTSLIEIDINHNFTKLGCTLDDAAGETYDKIGRMLNLPFPAGAQIDVISYNGSNIIKIPDVKTQGYDFSFSGIKTFMFNLIKKNEFNVEDICSSFQNKIVDILVKKSIKACKDKNIKNLIVAGGVAANSLLRSRLADVCLNSNINIYIPSKSLCLDNGAMIASAAYQILKNNKKIMEKVFAKSCLSIEEG